ncbi:MAG: class I SAM-dependent methyltransferase [Candidatus Nanohaloarchaeota archaeon QJJ-9]|nr:class I SAM-dependent methyltransferase [Candidatus Nanohaloarchaeota archaeon QJJ-9]
MPEEWFEDEEFWNTFKDYLFDLDRLDKSEEQVEDVVDLVDLEPGAKVLDQACGIGRHVVEFSKMGFDVTGIDITEKFLEEARRIVDGKNQEAELIHADMREFVREEEFDLVVNLFTSFGYFEGREDDRKVVKNVYHSLSEGGAYVVDIKGKEIMAERFQERDWHNLEGGYVLEEREMTRDWSWMENRWILVKGGEAKVYEVPHRLYSAYELRSLFEEVGFSEVEVYGSFKGDEYGLDSEKLIVVGYK